MTPLEDGSRHDAARSDGDACLGAKGSAYVRAFVFFAFFALCAVAMLCDCDTATAAEASVQQPPAYGHAIADVLEQKVLLEQQGHRVDLVAPPSAGRISLWLERRPSSISTDSAGRRWLALRYQIINAPEQLTSVTIPALKLPLASGATLDIPEWPVTVAPLTLSEPPNAGRLTPLQSDRIVAAPPLPPIRRSIAIWGSATFVILIAWGAWWFWREQRERAGLPFARTWRALRGRDAASMEGDVETWRLLHDALNATAGRVVRPRSLPELLRHAPHLQTLEPQIETFFRRSSARFFQDAQNAQPPQREHFSLREFARALYRAERRNRR
jgi:mxaA protein